jgi:hypothetical protein
VECRESDIQNIQIKALIFVQKVEMKQNAKFLLTLWQQCGIIKRVVKRATSQKERKEVNKNEEIGNQGI